MLPRGRRQRRACLPALLALVLLGWAGVRSVVMQAAMAAPATSVVCPEMAGMASASTPARHAPKPAGKAPACPWCAAAAHAPLDCAVVRPPAPAHTVTFAAYAAPPASGPRGPPARRPSARDPPFSA